MSGGGRRVQELVTCELLEVVGDIGCLFGFIGILSRQSLIGPEYTRTKHIRNKIEYPCLVAHYPRSLGNLASTLG